MRHFINLETNAASVSHHFGTSCVKGSNLLTPEFLKYKADY